MKEKTGEIFSISNDNASTVKVNNDSDSTTNNDNN